MKAIIKWGLIPFAAAVISWVIMSWPLPRYITTGIPLTACNVERFETRNMFAGDHLQFLYHFWLSSETFSGRLKPFYNVYEFNDGDDEERREALTYYLPFSVFFTIGNGVAGQAFGWNFTGFVSLWFTYIFSWLLLRRFIKHEGVAGCLAFLPMIWPYRWVTMLEGSPTGLAMMWVPALFWLLDRMVRDKSVVSGALAAMVIYLAEWGDTHVFFFSVIFTPFWCWFCYIWDAHRVLPSLKEWGVLLKAASGFILVMLVGIWHIYQLHQVIEGTNVAAEGRSIREVAANSRAFDNMIDFDNIRVGRRLYIGGFLLLIWSGLFVVTIAGSMRRGKKYLVGQWPFMLVPLALLGIIFLAVGTRNPGGERAWIWLGKIIPPYAMIRQPDKILCVFPVLFAVSLAIMIDYLWDWYVLRRRIILWGTAICMVLALADFAHHIMPGMCMLDKEQGAYAAVADDAACRGVDSRVIILPIWPGDSHYASVYQYYVSLYRIRMMNGYGGTIVKAYNDNVFNVYEWMNLGCADEKTLNSLLDKGVEYVLLHEDAFPEKVSPFAVSYTLQSLINNPRLVQLARDGPVWAFRITHPDEPMNTKRIDKLPFVSAAIHPELEQTERDPQVRIVVDDQASMQAYLELSAVGQWFAYDMPGFMCLSDVAEWAVRVRGDGVVHLTDKENASSSFECEIAVHSSDWIWQRIPLQVFEQVQGRKIRFELREGHVDFDTATIIYGDWKAPDIGETLILPAFTFFHAGFTTDDFESIQFRADYEPDTVIFYGPKLPLPAGAYRLEMIFNSTAPDGTVLGQGIIRKQDNTETDGFDVVAGSPAVCSVAHNVDLPFCFGFRFNREADISIRSLHITREK